MFVEESANALQATVRGTQYYFCCESCLRTFTAPEVELRWLKRAVTLSVALAVPTLTLSYVSFSMPVPLPLLLLVLATPVQFVAGWRFYQGAWNAIKMRMSNMDFLIALGTSAAYFYSLVYVFFPSEFPYGGLFFDASTMVTALILIGKLIEHSVRGKATDAIRKLMDLQPRTATVLRNGIEEEIPIEKVQVGDVFLVKPGRKIATDGTVIEGHSSVDEKFLTGESIPVEKSVGDDAIGASINMGGYLKLKATRVGADTTLSKIVQVVQEAQNTKSPVERLADKISAYFVPAVVAIALVSFWSWIMIGNKPVSFAFTAAVAVLVIACPCALGLATPAAIVVGAGKGAENGILIKGGEYLERAQKIDTVVFDKTGTLTKGEPSVTDIVVVDNSKYDEDQVLLLAAVAEKQSEHPLASAILQKFADGKIPDPDSFQSISGEGVHITYRGDDILLGNSKLLESHGIRIDGDVQAMLDRLRVDGKTAIMLTVNQKVAGVIAVADTVKESAREAVRALQKMRLDVIMLTGDNELTAEAVAQNLGIKRFFAGVLPVEKSQVVKQLQSEGRIVAMVGDGVNDAPALAQSDVGVAIGSGSDIAVETGGLILMRDDLRDVAAGIQLSRKTMTKIKENLVWAFAYNVALIPVAAGLFYFITGVLLNPILSGAAMAMSSVTVVSNSLTLRRFKPML
jgi:Cu+-exporting ATPase